ncbi:MAG: cupin domain-containing protein [Pedobacter sp.]|nr:cupin domain-containing protein [Pedobacter sp.]
MLGGYFMFEPTDAALLVSLLPALIHVRGAERLSTLVRLVAEETREDTPPGLLRGLSDARISLAMRKMHGDPASPWTVEELALEAALSRSAFFDHFMRIVGLAPME